MFSVLFACPWPRPLPRGSATSWRHLSRHRPPNKNRRAERGGEDDLATGEIVDTEGITTAPACGLDTLGKTGALPSADQE
jgi:hypothetical protein